MITRGKNLPGFARFSWSVKESQIVAPVDAAEALE
jgi:hypothetical protein